MSVKSPPQNTSLQVTALLRPHFCCDCDIVKYFPRCRCDCTAIRQHFNRRCTFGSRRYYSPTGRGTTVERISLCVCICIGLCSSGRTYISGITCPNFTKFPVAAFRYIMYFFFHFYGAMLCIRGTRHGPVSVRPSVCHKSVLPCSTKTAKRRITQITLHDSSGTLVFWCQRSLRNSTGVIPYGAPNAGGVGQNRRLSTNNRLYLENGTR